MIRIAEMTEPITDVDKTLKEGVFGVRDIETKTDLNVVQIESISKLKTLSIMFGSTILDQHLNEFMALQKSKDRKSLSEFIEGFRSKKSEALEKIKSGFHMLG